MKSDSDQVLLWNGLIYGYGEQISYKFGFKVNFFTKAYELSNSGLLLVVNSSYLSEF